MTDFKKHKNLKSAYKVPEDYFESKRKVLLEIPNDDQGDRVKVFRLGGGWIASGIAAALMIGLFFLTPKPYEAETSYEFDQEEIEEYLLSSYDYELNEDYLMMEVDWGNLGITDTTGLSYEELEYLIEEDFDQSLHYEYL